MLDEDVTLEEETQQEEPQVQFPKPKDRERTLPPVKKPKLPIEKNVNSAPADRKAVGWWQIQKIEKEDGTVLERPIDWVLAKNIGDDTYAHLQKYIRDEIIFTHGEGTYTARPCTSSRQPIRDAEFYTFDFDGASAGGGKLLNDHDYERQSISQKRMELKLREEQMRLEIAEQKLAEREDEMLGKKRGDSPFAPQWVAYFQKHKMAIPSTDQIPHFPPPTDASPDNGMGGMHPLMLHMLMSNGKGGDSDEVSALKEELREMRKAMSEKKEDTTTNLLVMLFKKSEEDKQEAERRRQEERKAEAELRREEKREREADRKAEKEKFDAEMKLLRAQMEKKEELEKDRSRQEQNQLIALFKLLKEDSGGSSKLMLEMSKAQANMMNTISAQQFNMATGSARQILDLANMVKATIGDKDEKPNSLTHALVEQFGKVLSPYAQADANAKQLQGLANEMGVSPQEAGQLIKTLRGAGAFSGSAPSSPVVPPQIADGTNGATAGQPSVPARPEGDMMAALIDRYMEEAPEIIETIVLSIEADEGTDDCVEMMLEQPSTVRTIICTWPYEKIAQDISKNLPTDRADILKSEKGKVWWNKFKEDLKSAVKEIREQDKAEANVGAQ